jgi:serpin B
VSTFSSVALTMLLASSGLSQDPADRARTAAAEISAVVQNQTQFAWDVYGRLRERPGNIGFAPFSLSTALAMLHAGARGQTAEQIGRVLRLPEDTASAQRAFRSLNHGLLGAAGPRGVKFTSANGLWARKGLGVLPEYLATIEAQFHGTVKEAAFDDDPELARRSINDWVKTNTDGTISEFFKPDAVDESTQLILVNAMTFKAAWAAPFKKDRTRADDFHVSPTKKIETPFMEQIGKFRMAKTAVGEALELPYSGNDMALVILLPRQQLGLVDMEKSLSGASLSEWMGRLKPETVAVSLPRFSISAELELEDILTDLGMPLAFESKGSDFTGMASAAQPFALTNIAQHVRIDADEAGTEAAAATGVRLGRGLPDPSIREFRADHPFLFVLRELRTGTILLLGRLENPTAVRK